ncbi:MAG: DUF58 domain-containing protein, partial [Gammaproteobacteria bacterium]|nr:DUF58 domain-containing protein [Gammaproteobacteria bacterium]
FREERERSVVLCVDQGPHMSFGTRGTFKSIQAARTAALLGWAANSLNDRVGGLLFGDSASTAHHFRPTKDRRALWRLLRALSRPSEGAEAVKDPLLNALQRAERGTATGSLIFIIADLNREVTSLETTIGRLSQRHSLVLIPIDDKADHDLPDVGRALFTDHAGHLLEIETGDDAGRTAYRKSWEQNRQFLAGIANRLRIPLIPVATDDEVHQALMRGMRHTRRLQ